MVLIKGAPYIYSGAIVYLIEEIDQDTVSVVFQNNGKKELKKKSISPAFIAPDFKWRFSDIFIDVSVPLSLPNGTDVSWDEIIQNPYNSYCRANKIYDMPVFGVYKGVLFTFDELKEKVLEYLRYNGKI